MLLSRRSLLLALPVGAMAAATAGPASRAAAPAGTAPAVIEQFYDTLLAVMKQAKQLAFDQRYARLAPAITQAFNLPLMTRIAVGPDWTQLSADQQQRLQTAFSRYTISVYANRFDGYDGEHFEVTPTTQANANGVIVKSRLIKANGEPVALDYLMRQDASGLWQVIDVYLSGTVSELAARRSEFVSVLQRNGAEGLVQLIEQRTAALRPG